MIIPRRSLYMGLDASRSRAATGLVGVVRDGEFYDVVYVGLWRPQKGKPVDLNLVSSKVETAHARDLLGMVAVDPFGMFSKLSEWESMNLPFMEIGQTATRYKTDSLLLELIQQGKIRHNGDKDLRRHIGQAALLETVRGVRIDKQRGVNNDLSIALALACWCATEEDFQPVKINVYRGNPFFSGLQGFLREDGYQEVGGVTYDPSRQGLAIDVGQRHYEALVKDHKFSTCRYRTRGCAKCIEVLDKLRYSRMDLSESEDLKNRLLSGETAYG